MRRLLAFTALLSNSSTLLIASPSHATPADGTYVCSTGLAGSTSPTYRIDSGVVNAGQSCTGSVVIPTGAVAISGNTFRTSTLSSITIPGSVTSIGRAAFQLATSLTSVTIPNSVTSIGREAFDQASALTSVTLGSGITSIPDKAFYGATALTTVTIPNSVTSIGTNAFAQARGLTSVNLGSGVTSIGDYAFFNASSLSSITIPNSVTSIGGAAFMSATSLSSITVPDSVTSIGTEAFNGMTALTSVTIGSGVTSMGNSVFRNSTSLTTIRFQGIAPASIGPFLFTNIGPSPKVLVKRSATGYDVTSSPWNSITIEIFDEAPNQSNAGSSAPTLLRAQLVSPPVISGKARVSKTLRLNSVFWWGLPAPEATVSWYSCSKRVRSATQTVPSTCQPITNATGESLKLTALTLGRFVSAKVTGVSSGTLPTKWLSRSTTKIR